MNSKWTNVQLNSTQKNFSPHWKGESLHLLASIASEGYAAVAAEEGAFVLAAAS